MEEVTLATKDYVDGKSVSIDQTYNPLSENAQSGTAVAEAVEDKQDKFADIDTGSNDVDITINGITNDDAKVLFRNDYGQVLRITAPNPIIDSDVANKKYVDNNIAAETKRANNTFANALKGSISGEAVTMKDVSPVEHDMAVKVRGKNLIPYPYAETTKTINGITFTDNGDGTITANGTATANTYYTFTELNLYPKGNYFISGCPTGGSISTYFLNCTNRNGAHYTIYKTDIGNGTTVNLDDADTLKFTVRILSGAVVNNLTFKPQLELGTTATPYTPYISDLTDVKVAKLGKNLFDKDNPNKINGYFSADGDSISPAPSTRSIYLSCKPNTSYTASKITSARFALGFTSEVPAGGVEVNGVAVSYSGATTLTSTSPADAKYLVVWFYHQTYDTGITEDEIMNTIQVELGSAATEYEAYAAPTEYAPNTDGTVEGVTSLYPTTTLTTDTAGAIIDCEYSRDINKAFAELQQAVISMGGNI